MAIILLFVHVTNENTNCIKIRQIDHYVTQYFEFTIKTRKASTCMRLCVFFSTFRPLKTGDYKLFTRFRVDSSIAGHRVVAYETFYFRGNAEDDKHSKMVNLRELDLHAFVKISSCSSNTKYCQDFV